MFVETDGVIVLFSVTGLAYFKLCDCVTVIAVHSIHVDFTSLSCLSFVLKNHKTWYSEYFS